MLEIGTGSGSLTAGLGNLAHLTFAMLGNKEGFDAIHVPYKGQAPAQMALMAGEVEAMFDIPNSAPNFEAGKIKPLAITAPKRVARLPNIPTMGEAGYPLDVNYWMGIFVPAGTPPAIVNKVNEAIRAAAADPAGRSARRTTPARAGCGRSPADTRR